MSGESQGRCQRSSEIADALGVWVNTVTMHARTIHPTLGVSGWREAVRELL